MKTLTEIKRQGNILQQDEIRFQIMTITPDMAEQLLEHNPNWRAISDARVAQLVRDIESGDFQVTHQVIAVDKNGDIVDGQHRLKAIWTAGIPVRMGVATYANGITPLALRHVDTGWNRRMYHLIQEPRLVTEVYQTLFRLARISADHGTVNRPQVVQVEKLSAHFKDKASELIAYCPRTRRGGYSNAGFRAAAVMAWDEGEDGDYVMSLYRDIATAKHTVLPKVGQSLFEVAHSHKLLEKAMTSQDKWAELAYVRGRYVFEKRHRNSSVRIHETYRERILAETKAKIRQILNAD